MNSLNKIARWIYHSPSILKAIGGKSKESFIHITPSMVPPPSNPKAEKDLDRRSKLLCHIPVPSSMDGVEIGALDKPIISKVESGGRIKYVDIAKATELRATWKDNPDINIENIVETDYVCADKGLPEAIGKNQVDYVIASHVAEHVPDLIGWLKQIEDVLRDHGILSLAVPDKRYIFDLLRDTTTPGMIIEAYLFHRRKPAPREVFDFAYYARTVDADAIWDGTIETNSLPHFTDLEGSFQLAKYCLDNYKDAHVNVFTPASFLDLLEVVSRLDLIDLAIADFFNTAKRTIEFFVSLERLPRNFSRQEILSAQLSGLEKARTRILISEG